MTLLLMVLAFASVNGSGNREKDKIAKIRALLDWAYDLGPNLTFAQKYHEQPKLETDKQQDVKSLWGTIKRKRQCHNEPYAMLLQNEYLDRDYMNYIVETSGKNHHGKSDEDKARIQSYMEQLVSFVVRKRYVPKSNETNQVDGSILRFNEVDGAQMGPWWYRTKTDWRPESKYAVYYDFDDHYRKCSDPDYRAACKTLKEDYDEYREQRIAAGKEYEENARAHALKRRQELEQLRQESLERRDARRRAEQVVQRDRQLLPKIPKKRNYRDFKQPTSRCKKRKLNPPPVAASSPPVMDRDNKLILGNQLKTAAKKALEYFQSERADSMIGYIFDGLSDSDLEAKLAKWDSRIKIAETRLAHWDNNQSASAR